MNQSPAHQFVTALFGDVVAPDRNIVIWRKKDKHVRFFSSVREAAEYALAQTCDAFHGCGLYRPGITEGRGKEADVVAIPSLWGDIDVNNPQRKNHNCPKSMDEAQGLVRAMPVPVSILIGSGFGLHPYWLLAEPWVFTDEEDRQRAKRFTKGWHALLCQLASESGWSLENCGDLTRVLRPPGTVNYKYNLPVTILEFHPDRRYEPADFDSYLIDVADDPSAVESIKSGSLILKADAKAPEAKLTALLDHDPKFRETWEHKRTDLGDPSFSGYDLAITSRLVSAGWSEQEVADSLIEHRRTHGRNGAVTKALRGDYIGRTIAKAKKPDKAHITTAGSDDPPRCTDLGNARRFARQHRGRVRFCHPWGCWLIWDGKVWSEDSSGQVIALAKVTVRAIYGEAGKPGTTDERADLAKWAVHSESEARIKAMLALAKSEPGIPVLPADLDADPWLLNTNTGVIDLHTGELRAHDPADLITKLAPVDFIPDAQAPRFEEFLTEIMPDNADLIGFVQRMIGYCLTGDVSEHVLLIFWGSGRNGKSVFIESVLHVMGDYAGTAAPDLLTISRGERHPTELADLHGKRLIVASETEQGRRLRVQLVKSITGDEIIKARKMRQDFYQFTRTHKTILVTNNKPIVTEDTTAIWTRIKLIPFTVSFAGREDKKLGEKLRAEAPGILALLVKGCLAWQRDGLGEPEAVTGATDEYRQEQDQLGPFVEERCILAPNASVTRTGIWAAYQEWAKHERHPLDRNGLYARLRQLAGVTDGWVSRKHGFSGIGLLANNDLKRDSLFGPAGET